MIAVFPAPGAPVMMNLLISFPSSGTIRTLANYAEACKRLGSGPGDFRDYVVIAVREVGNDDVKLIEASG